MSGPESSVTDEMVKEALDAFVDPEHWDSTGWLPNMRRALEAVWPEPSFTEEESQMAATALRVLMDGRTTEHIRDCSRCQLSLRTLAKLERADGS